MNIDPNFGISDIDAMKLWPKEGFLRQYIDYMRHCTDAPIIYHLGSAMAALSIASANTDIMIERKDNKFYPLPTHMWIAIMGYSGDRKSKAMGSAMRILKNAFIEYNNYDCVLPGDGSLEAWHDFLTEHNNAILYRDELASVLDQSKRGYSDGMKHWLLELDQGEPKRKITRKDNDDKIIQRPRLSIIGAIPPNVFKEKINKADWKSGFIARFMFFAATRSHFLDAPSIDKTVEHYMSIWMAHVACASRGNITIPYNIAREVFNWIKINVEDQRMDYQDEVYSNLIRFQDFGFKLCAMYCMARQTKSQSSELGSIIANDEDMNLAIKCLNSLKKTGKEIFADISESYDSASENEIIKVMRRYPETQWTVSALSEALNMSRTYIMKYTKLLLAADVISVHKAPKSLHKTDYTNDRVTGRKNIFFVLN